MPSVGKNLVLGNLSVLQLCVIYNLLNCEASVSKCVLENNQMRYTVEGFKKKKLLVTREVLLFTPPPQTVHHYINVACVSVQQCCVSVLLSSLCHLPQKVNL